MEKGTHTLLELPVRPPLTSWGRQNVGAPGYPEHGGEGPFRSEEGQLGGAVSSSPLRGGARRMSAGPSLISGPLCGQTNGVRTNVGSVLQELQRSE